MKQTKASQSARYFSNLKQRRKRKIPLLQNLHPVASFTSTSSSTRRSTSNFRKLDIKTQSKPLVKKSKMWQTIDKRSSQKSKKSSLLKRALTRRPQSIQDLLTQTYTPRQMTQINSQSKLRSSKKRNSSRKRPRSSIKVESISPFNSQRNYQNHMVTTYQALKLVQTFPPIDSETLQQKQIFLPYPKNFYSKKTVIFDLDETLVHCVEDFENEACHTVLDVLFTTGELVKAGIRVRPYVHELLTYASKYFEVIVFTASFKCYADAVLDFIDPQNQLIHHRLYRENCIEVNGVFIKDLRIFQGRQLQNIIIVDNSAYSFAFQLSNGIPIISWYQDPFDMELYNLIGYLEKLRQCDDIRIENEEQFNLQSFVQEFEEKYVEKLPDSPIIITQM